MNISSQQDDSGRLRTAFVVSTGRTGTGFLTRLVNEASGNGWSLHEPWPAFRRRSRALMHRGPNLYERLYFGLPRIYRQRRNGKQWYVENNFQLFAAMPLIRKTFPGAVVVHVVRDGRDVVTSYLNRWRYIVNSHITPADLVDDPAAEKWCDWNPLQKLAWYWRTVNRRISDEKADLVIRFEDMFRDDGRGVFDFLDGLPGLDYDRGKVRELLGKRVNVNRQTFFPDYDEWPRRWKDEFHEIAGDEMTYWGYGVRGDR